jgi:hypothetical protein
MKYIKYLFFSLLGLIGCKTSNNSQSFIGTFESKRGVMTDISQYCYNVGYLTVESGEQIPICFEKLGDELNIDCKKIEVRGFFEKRFQKDTQGAKTESNGMEILIVSEYKCVE